MYCSNLASVTIPNSVTKIGESAFDDCSILVTVNIAPIKREWGGSSFYDCPKISPASHAAPKRPGY
ncbi:MAG: leucine-rich repeat domain-containing protein [Treponema sp.]|nr:leucine-rich repeat domain-containing protein [Treponema sp.]